MASSLFPKWRLVLWIASASQDFCQGEDFNWWFNSLTKYSIRLMFIQSQNNWHLTSTYSLNFLGKIPCILHGMHSAKTYSWVAREVKSKTSSILKVSVWVLNSGESLDKCDGVFLHSKSLCVGEPLVAMRDASWVEWVDRVFRKLEQCFGKNRGRQGI